MGNLTGCEHGAKLLLFIYCGCVYFICIFVRIHALLNGCCPFSIAVRTHTKKKSIATDLSYPQKTLPQLLHLAAVVHRSSPELCDITTGHCLQAPNRFPHSPNYEAERRYATKFGKKNQKVYFKERIPSIDQTDFSCCYELLVIRIHANHLWVSMTLCHINLSLTSKHPVTAYEWVTS